MKKLFKRKWMIVVLAAVLALVIAGTAWAAAGTGSPNNSSTTQSTASADPGTTSTTAGNGNGHLGPLKGFLRGQRGGRFCNPGNQSQQGSGAYEQRLQNMLDQLKSKMTPEDQATLDQLVNKLKQDAQTLKTDSSELRSLIQKYLPAKNQNQGSTSPSSPSTTVPGGTTSTSTI